MCNTKTPCYDVAMIGCSRIAVVFGNNKINPSAVIRPFANVRHWKSYESVAQDIAEALRWRCCANVSYYHSSPSTTGRGCEGPARL